MADRTPPSREEYTAWLSDPITAYVLAGVKLIADRQPEQWLIDSWNAKRADAARLIQLQERADAYNELAALSYEDVIGAHNHEEPKA